MASARRKELGTKAATTGGGAGTLLIYIAHHLPAAYAWAAPYLIYAAPTAAMLSAWGWLYLERAIAHLAERWEERRNVKAFLKDKRRILDEALRDPNGTPEHKAAMQQLYQRYQEAAMKLKYAQLIKFQP